MNTTELRHKETLLIETLLSGLDARETAKSAGATLLCYLAELLIQRARGELENTRRMMEAAEEDTSNGEARA